MPSAHPTPALRLRPAPRAVTWLGAILALATTAAHAAGLFEARFLASETTRGATMVAIGDVNGDGIPDAVVPATSDNQVSVFRGIGDGRFHHRDSYPTPPGPAAVALGDLDGDGILDIVSANAGGHNLSVRLGDGNGGFGPRLDSPINGVGPAWIVLADLDADGDLDVVTANNGDCTARIGNGDGTFGYTENTAIIATWIGLADLNGNGLPDLVALSGDGTVRVAFGLGTGGFSISGTTWFAGGSPGRPALAPLDAGSALDLAVPNATGTVSVLLGDGSGGFAPRITYPAPTGSNSTTATDLDGDGLVDLAVTAPGILSVLRGTGGGAFGPANNFITGGSSRSSATGDFDSDGEQDVVVVNAAPDPTTGASNLNLFLGNGDGTLGKPRDQPTGSGPWSIATGDVNGDAKADVVTGNVNTVSVLLGNGDGTLAAGLHLPSGLNAYAVALRDLDGDTKLDLIACENESNVVAVRLGNGDGTFGVATTHATALRPVELALADIDGDGDQDLAVACEGGSAISVLKGDGAGSFSPRQDYPEFSFGIGVALGDVNTDGRLDLVSCSGSSQDRLSVRLGQPGGTFGSRVDLALPPASYEAMAMGDLTGDGKLDVAIAERNSAQVFLHPGLGNGTFGSPQVRESGPFPNDLLAVDLTGDGDQELVIVSERANEVSVHLASSLGLSLHRTGFGTHRTPFAAAVADFNGDGRLDLAAVTRDSSRVSILLQAPGGNVSVGEDPAAFRWLGAWPTPATSAVRVAFELAEPATVETDVFDVTGRRVRVLQRGERTAGRHDVHWDGRGDDGSPLAGGVYLIRIASRDIQRIARVVMLR